MAKKFITHQDAVHILGKICPRSDPDILIGKFANMDPTFITYICIRDIFPLTMMTYLNIKLPSCPVVVIVDRFFGYRVISQCRKKEVR